MTADHNVCRKRLHEPSRHEPHLVLPPIPPGGRRACTLALTLLLILLLFPRDCADHGGDLGAFRYLCARDDRAADHALADLASPFKSCRTGAETSFLAVLLLAGVGFAWLLGELAAVNALPSLPWSAMLILAVPAVLGWDGRPPHRLSAVLPALRRPFWRLHPAQADGMDGDATVFGLRLSGIPVYHEGSIW
jgi:hypothetical protein